MKYLFFINPSAGKGKAQKNIIESINNFFFSKDYDYKIILTEYQGHAEKTAKEYAQTNDEYMMFACGGEGTVYEVLNGIVGFDNVSLGVIPCGSANDFLKIFSDKKPFLDIDAQIKGVGRRIDIIKAGDRFCINGCSIGMDAMVARDMSKFKSLPLISGSLAYRLAIARTFIRKLGVNVKLCIDGSDVGEKHCLFTVVANALFYGGGYMAAPDALVNDGLLDFTMVDVIPRIDILRFLPKYEKGDIKNLKCCHLKKCKSMSFKSDNEIPVNLDGEIVMRNELSFSIIEKGIRFIVPRGLELPENLKKEKVINNY